MLDNIVGTIFGVIVLFALPALLAYAVLRDAFGLF